MECGRELKLGSFAVFILFLGGTTCRGLRYHGAATATATAGHRGIRLADY